MTDRHPQVGQDFRPQVGQESGDQQPQQPQRHEIDQKERREDRWKDRQEGLQRFVPGTAEATALLTKDSTKAFPHVSVVCRCVLDVL